MTPFTLGPALLFCPADRPDRFAKALSRADGVILDLEDAVGEDAKSRARGALIDAELDPARVVVRVSPPSSPAFAADIATLSQTDLRTVMIAKAEDPAQLSGIDERFAVIAMCETARGVLGAADLAAHPRVSALAWGAEDLIASLGGTSSRRPDGRYRDVVRTARSRVLLAAAAHGRAAIDAVDADISRMKRLEDDAREAAASGFLATACIHPDQVPVIRSAYRPDAKTVQWARGVLTEAETASGVFTYAGRMVDEPVLRHARVVLARAAV